MDTMVDILRRRKEITVKILGTYTNGNTKVIIYDDGTKVRMTNDDEFRPEFAENIDLKITNHCSGANCAYCHEGSSQHGTHADIMSESFVDTLHPYQEIAIGGGDATIHPDLIPFLKKLKSRNVIANMTVNQRHFEEKQELLKYLVEEKLIYGLGISLVQPTEDFIELIKDYPNAVIHVINGIVSYEDLNPLFYNKLKLLILGYKDLRRGHEFNQSYGDIIKSKQSWLYDNLSDLFNKFKVVSFDNLAIDQLDVKRFLTDEEWERFYMGDDATFTYYIDAVTRTFAKNSVAPLNERYTLLDSVDDMFKIIRNKKGNAK